MVNKKDHIKNNKKKKQAIRDKYKKDLADKINAHKNKIPYPINLKYDDINSNSWFDIKKSTFDGKITNEKCNIRQFPNELIKCKKVIIKPLPVQKRIILKWMRACELMYNKIIKYFKTGQFNKTFYTTNFKKLRQQFKNERNLLVKKYDIPVHIIDCSIKRACGNLKSCLSNMANGHIKHFRLRYLKDKNPHKIIEIEQGFFSKNKNTFCSTYLGKTIDSDNFDLKTIRTLYKSDCTLHFNMKLNRFTLLVPQTEKPVQNNSQHVISIDPGIRTFVTGLSNNHTIKLGNNLSTTIKSKLKKIDEINNKHIPNKIKKRYETLNNKKIHDLVTDLHWKTINFLTNNYKTIFIGKWSTKNICLTSTSVLPKMLKRISQKLRYYEFLQKLRFKCDLKKIHLEIVHEGYTSKLCSFCGWENKMLGGGEVFVCKQCTKKIDRDLNGARNIFIKSQ